MFPDFNIYSLPLLILVAQGLILSFMIFNKYFSKRNISYLFLGFLLLIACYHRTTYTVGFMAWYDTFRNTKINYYLISLGLAVGPLIYLYIKSCVQLGFSFKTKYYLHFVPVLIYVLFKLLVLGYDSQQAGYEDTQNGELYLWTMEDNLTILMSTLFTLHLMIYLVMSMKLYFKFRSGLEQEYSNTYKYELRWLRNFLYAYAFLFVYDTLQMITDGFIFQLHWTQEWWYQFFSVLVVIYLGVMGYFTPVESLQKIELDSIPDFDIKEPSESAAENDYSKEVEKISSLLESDKLYLDPSLSLTQLSLKTKISSSQLSRIINNGLNKNFNDYINSYRVEEVKLGLADPSKAHLSILAIAYDSGFNSKATFNRVFKRIAGKSPSEFRK